MKIERRWMLWLRRKLFACRRLFTIGGLLRGFKLLSLVSGRVLYHYRKNRPTEKIKEEESPVMVITARDSHLYQLEESLFLMQGEWY